VTIEGSLGSLTKWYSEQARPLIERIAPDRLKEFDERLQSLGRLESPTEGRDVAICFLGAAGVGKSTLLNALISERKDLLPHGGVGSLTAQATILRHAAQPYLSVDYLDATTLRGILLVLETSFCREQKRHELPEDVINTLPQEEVRELQAELAATDADPRLSDAHERMEAYWRQVRLMIQGDQRGSLDSTYLLDGLRIALGLKPRWDRQLEAPDFKRATRIFECFRDIKAGRARVFRQVDLGAELFDQEIWNHASGFLAPTIRKLEVGWDAPIVRDDLVLVDLPGIGIANDEYRRVTHEWINKKARAIVLVVGARGVTESDADLLRQTGFFTRLLHDGDDAHAPPVTLAVTVVRVDEAATASWQRERAENRETARKWSQHFAEQCQRAEEMVRAQLSRELEKLDAASNEAIRTDREAATRRVLESMQVHAVSAPQYRALHVQDEEEPARIKKENESNIPRLREALVTLGTAHRERHQRRVSNAIMAFSNSVRAQLELDRAMWEQDQRAEREADSLRAELEEVLTPRRRELEVRQGAFREFLRNGIPLAIDSAVAEASSVAQDDIRRYLGKMQDLHWASLRSTVKKHGSHRTGSGRHVDLPNELTLRFEDPIAIIWSKSILTTLRKRTAEIGKDHVAIVSEVADWARSHDAKVSTKVVDKLLESMIADAKNLNAVGKEAVDELKQKVRDELYNQLERRIAAACKAFIDRREHEGPGVKSRILAFFRDELASDVTKTAAQVAKKVLNKNYNEVQGEIVEVLRQYSSPLDRVRDAFVTSHEDSVRRSDAKKRRAIIEDIDAALAHAPGNAQ
jgi:GTP-binding protein EngB required for normal cell division